MVVESESTSFVLYVEAEVMGMWVHGGYVGAVWLDNVVFTFQRKMVEHLVLIIKDLSLYSANGERDLSFYLKSR